MFTKIIILLGADAKRRLTMFLSVNYKRIASKKNTYFFLFLLFYYFLCIKFVIYFFMAFSVTGQNLSQSYYQEYVEVPCTMEYGNKSWVQNCNFTSYTCKMNCNVSNCEHMPNNISFEVCGHNCRLVDQCSEKIQEGGYHMCNATEYNLAIGEEKHKIEQISYCEGDQCNLKCNGIECIQICKEGEDGEYKRKAEMVGRL